MLPASCCSAAPGRLQSQPGGQSLWPAVPSARALPLPHLGNSPRDAQRQRSGVWGGGAVPPCRTLSGLAAKAVRGPCRRRQVDVFLRAVGAVKVASAPGRLSVAAAAKPHRPGPKQQKARPTALEAAGPRQGPWRGPSPRGRPDVWYLPVAEGELCGVFLRTLTRFTGAPLS